MDFSVASPTESYSRKIEETVDLNSRLSEIVDAALVAKRESEPRRTYLGGSRLGHPKAISAHDRGCERALWYEYKGYKSEKPFGADLYRVFDMGHDTESRTASYLRLASFDLRTEKAGGGQFGFAVAPDPDTKEPRVKGHLDGVIVSGPEIPGLVYPCLWECKGMKDKKWKDFKAKGVERSHPVYYGQCQTYMGFMDLKAALFTATNRDTGEIWYEVVKFNQDHAQAAVDRAARVLDARSAVWLSRITTDYDSFSCKWCSYRAQCQKDEETKPPAQGTFDTATPEWAK